MLAQITLLILLCALEMGLPSSGSVAGTVMSWDCSKDLLSQHVARSPAPIQAIATATGPSLLCLLVDEILVLFFCPKAYRDRAGLGALGSVASCPTTQHKQGKMTGQRRDRCEQGWHLDGWPGMSRGTKIYWVRFRYSWGILALGRALQWPRFSTDTKVSP